MVQVQQTLLAAGGIDQPHPGRTEQLVPHLPEECVVLEEPEAPVAPQIMLGVTFLRV